MDILSMHMKIKKFKPIIKLYKYYKTKFKRNKKRYNKTFMESINF